MKELSEITCLISDHGLFLPLALKLAQTYKRVLYHTPWERGFPSLNDCVLGDGFERLERCDDIWKVKSEVDLFVFPDIHHGGLQVELERQGFPVWGSRYGSNLEIYRRLFLKTLKEVGLTVPPFITCEGMTKLREHLKDNEDKYIKISKYRGSMETWHWRNWREDEGVLDSLAVELGPCKEMMMFLVFDAIETDLEIGGDTYCIDGEFPETMLHGLEWKDKGYLGSVTKTDAMPEQIREVNSAFAGNLREARYRNFWSTEIRVAGDQFYFMDPTCRCPCPGTASQLAIYKNLPEIIWHGAQGHMVQPEIESNYVAECVLTAKGERQTWRTVELPDKLREHVAFRGSCEMEGRLCFPPDEAHGDEIGWLIATGDSIKETIETLKERAKLLPDGVTANTESLVDLLKEAHSAEEQGIEFSDDKIPKPESVIAD